MRPVAQKRIYQLQAQSFQELEARVDTFRQVWETRLDAQDQPLPEVKTSQQNRGGNSEQ
jgi:hypothetical protein